MPSLPVLYNWRMRPLMLLLVIGLMRQKVYQPNIQKRISVYLEMVQTLLGTPIQIGIGLYKRHGAIRIKLMSV